MIMLILSSPALSTSPSETARMPRTKLADTSARLSEVTLQVTSLTNDKRRLEGDLAAMQSDLDDAINNQRAAEERAERLAAENARLADELRQEQENYKKRREPPQAAGD